MAGPNPVASGGRAARLSAKLSRFFALWAGVSGTHAALGGTCPCCGRPGCPLGVGVTATFGLVGALLLTQGRRLLAAVKRRVDRLLHRPVTGEHAGTGGTSFGSDGVSREAK